MEFIGILIALVGLLLFIVGFVGSFFVSAMSHGRKTDDASVAVAIIGLIILLVGASMVG